MVTVHYIHHQHYLQHHLLFIIINLICLQIQGGLSQYHSPHWNYQTSSYSNYHNPSYSTYYRNINNPSPAVPTSETKTEYGFETFQIGSAYVNPRQKNYTPVHVGPDKDQTQHYFVTTNTTTHHLPQSKLQTQRLSTAVQSSPTDLRSDASYLLSRTTTMQINNQTSIALHPRRHHRRHHHHRSNGDCVKCPPEKVIIAQKGLDGVLIEPPKLMSCHNRALLNGVYYIETLFGPQFKFLLPHGTHSFHGKIRSKRNLKFEQTCLLKYKVIVQQCGKFYSQDNNLRVKCDPGYIWGSKCHFTCRTGYLSHNEPMICGDILRWEGDEPECLSEPPTTTYFSSRSSPSSTFCDFIEIPENGKFSCQYPQNVNSEDYENELITPDGTICRVTCNRNYEIPNNLIQYSILRCENGGWNSTAQDLCRSKSRY